MKKRVLLVDDHVSIREMLARALALEGDYLVVGEASTGLGALRLCSQVPADVVILDLILPEVSGLEVMRRLRRDLPMLRILVYSGASERAQVHAALQQHPHGYVMKSDPLCTLREGIRVVATGGRYFSAFATSVGGAMPCYEGAELTDREREILHLVATSYSSKQIAACLNIATKTVENHRARIMEKLELHDVAGLTRWALRHGLVL